jgi:hypothetical protein
MLNKENYLKIMNYLKSNFLILRFCDYDPTKTYDKIVCLIRHEIDEFNGIQTSLEIAQLEHSLGIHTTFFVLIGPTSPYDKHRYFLPAIKEIQNMGHEIGFHNNIVSDCIFLGSQDPHGILMKALEFLKENDLIIHGVSQHGDSRCAQYKYMNYQIFKECKFTEANWKRLTPQNFTERDPKGLQYGEIFIPFYTESLKELGLYEAYFLVPEDESDSMSDLESNQADRIIHFAEKITKKRKITVFQLVLHPWRHDREWRG